MVTYEALFMLLSLLISLSTLVFYMCEHIFNTKKK